MSVSGYGTAESLVAYVNEGYRYNPDYVLLEWHFSDIDDNIRSKLFDVSVDGELERRNEEYLPGIAVRDMLDDYQAYDLLMNNSHLFYKLRQPVAMEIKKLLTFRNKKSAEVNADQGDKDRRKQHTLSGAILNEFLNSVENRGSRLIVLDVPKKRIKRGVEMPLSSYEWWPEDASDQIVRLSPMKKLGRLANMGKPLYTVRGHNHFTSHGYEAVADTAFEYLASRTCH